MLSSNLRLATLLALLTLPMLGCQSPPVWQSVQHSASFDEVWGKFDQIAARRGFPIDLSESDRGMRKFVSKWREQPAPFGMGSRTRLHGEFERREDQPGWLLRFHIERQAIRDISVGFDPQDGDWEDGGQDFTAEQTLLGQLRLAFGQKLGIDPSFEQSR